MQPIEPIIRPRRLKKGATIGVVAPAGAFARDPFEKGLDILESMGFRVRVSEELHTQDGYFAGSDIHRARLLQNCFMDTSVEAIFCARGGYGSMRILSFLDWAQIRKHPKVFIGFSDITAVLATLYTRCGLVTFHGPTINTLETADQQTRTAILASLTGNRPVQLEAGQGTTIRSGAATAPVMAGNLATLCHLVGTPFQPDFQRHILLVEDTGEALYRIDRMLTQMRLAGCFHGLAGLALGSFNNCAPTAEVYDLFDRFFSTEKFPIAAGFEFGHEGCNRTIPIGVSATLDADRRCLIYAEPATV